jgi:hypothetical protein
MSQTAFVLWVAREHEPCPRAHEPVNGFGDTRGTGRCADPDLPVVSLGRGRSEHARGDEDGNGGPSGHPPKAPLTHWPAGRALAHRVMLSKRVR